MKVGIDFGTTFSLPSCVINGSPSTLLPNGEYGLPSLFYFDTELGIQIGTAAEDNGIYRPDNLIRDIKMKISFPDDKFIIDRKIFTKKEVVGSILREIGNLAKEECLRREYESQDLDGVVISVPAKFNLREINIINEAAEMPVHQNGAGLTVLGFIREPVAAAIAYFNAPKTEDKINILVYDLGGGTCDIAIVRSDKSSAEWYTVIDSEMQRIGGRDWDKMVVSLIKQKFIEKYSVSSFNGNEEEEIYRQAVSTKEMLTRNNVARAQLMVDGRILSCVITREEFECITAELLNKTIDMVEKLIKESSCDIDYIVCVGGSSNMPQIKNVLTKKYPSIPVKIYEPEKAIAFGAAIYAEHLKEPRYLRDICKFSYGARYIDNYEKYHDENRLIIYNIIFKGSKLPAIGTSNSYPFKDNQDGTFLAIYESECKDNKYLPEKGNYIGDISITGLEGRTKNDTTVLTMVIDQSGLMSLNAVDIKTGKSENVKIQLRKF